MGVLPNAAPPLRPARPPAVLPAVPNPACKLVCPSPFLPANSNPAKTADSRGTLRKFFKPLNAPGFIPVIVGPFHLNGFNLLRFLTIPG